MKTDNKMAYGCTFLFLAPFCLFGLGALIGGLVALARGQWQPAAILVVFGMVFAGVGFGLLAAAICGMKSKKRKEAVKEQHPDEPWLWREDWARGRVEPASTLGLAGVWIIALIWNAIAWPVTVMVILEEVVKKKNSAGLLVLLFAAVGLMLLVWAIRRTIRRKKFGVSWFELASMPGVIGGTLSGVVYTQVKLIPEDGFHTELSCINRVVTGSGKNRSVSEHVQWQDEQTVTRDLMQTDPSRSAIPVWFQIPYECRETNDDNSDNRILWRLELSAAVPGMDYEEAFEIPVFRTEDSSPEPVKMENPMAQYVATQPPLSGPISRGITVGPGMSGGTEFYFGPARNLGVALMFTIFGLIWSGAIVFMIKFKAPLAFPIIFGFFDIFIVLGVLSSWFGTSRADISPGVMRIRESLLGIAKTCEIELEEVESIDSRVTSQLGKRPLYSIQINCRGGKTYLVGGGIRDRRELDWLIAEMTREVERCRP